MTAEPLPPPSAHEDDPEGGFQLTPQLLSAVHDLGKASPEFRAAVARLLLDPSADPGPRLRPVGRARKVSVSMPEDLTAAVQQRVGRGEFSQYVTEAVARQLELDLLAELSAMLEAEHGPVSEEALAEARRSWPDV
ncbi:hypothetical protein [Micromonospora sp. NPDC006431]|uniref:hypothetical protein n=1 Tax=Micromonospora sp. NPDC006431 TaxID=3364235 RepID=UPI003683301E